MFFLVPAYPGCPGSKAVKRSLLLLLLLQHPFNGLFSRTTWVSRYRKGKTSVDLNEARADDGVLGCSNISWVICKRSAPRCRQIVTPTPRHSNFYRLDALPNYCKKKLNSLKHLVRTTSAKTADMKKALLISSTSPFSQCADK